VDGARFDRLWRQAGGGSESQNVFSELYVLYTGPDRHYHSLEHIARCLAHYDRATPELGVHPAVEMAIWCHDVVYDTGASDNEARSVEWFSSRGKGFLSSAYVEEVSEIILATRHTAAPNNRNAQFMVDVDLAGLGQQWDAFFADTQNLFKEADSKNKATFYLSQCAFLQNLANRPFIFSTPHFRSAYEQTARDNIARLVQEVSSPSYGSNGLTV
jgi:predicted metal-dependent HD superfamily phosphohydrolase